MSKPRKKYYYVIGVEDDWGGEGVEWKIQKRAHHFWGSLRFDNYWLAHGFVQFIKADPPLDVEDAQIVYLCRKIMKEKRPGFKAIEYRRVNKGALLVKTQIVQCQL